MCSLVFSQRIIGDAVALTIEPLSVGETFEVVLVKTSSVQHRGGLEIGVTTNNPDSLILPHTMTDCTINASYMISGKHVVRNKVAMHRIDTTTEQIDVILFI